MKEKIADAKTILQIHLFNDVFFYGSYTFTNYRNKEKEKENIYEALRKKYLNDSKDTDFTSIGIRDNKNNRIIVSDNTYVTVQYLAGNTGVIEAINQSIINKNNERILAHENRIKAFLDYL